MWRCLGEHTFSHCARTPTCDEQTDGQIHGHSKYCASIASRGKNQMQKERNEFMDKTSSITVASGVEYVLHWLMQNSFFSSLCNCTDLVSITKIVHGSLSGAEL